MSLRGLLSVVGGGVAAEHGRGRVAEEELHVYLAGLLFDGPGGEGVAEAVRVEVLARGAAALTAVLPAVHYSTVGGAW